MLLANPTLPAVSFMPQVMSVYLLLSIKVRMDCDCPLFDFTSIGTRLLRVRIKKSSSSVES